MRRETGTTRMVATDGHRHIGSELVFVFVFLLVFVRACVCNTIRTSVSQE